MICFNKEAHSVKLVPTEAPIAYYCGKTLIYVSDGAGVDYVLEKHWFMYFGIRCYPPQKVVHFDRTKDLKAAVLEKGIML